MLYLEIQKYIKATRRPVFDKFVEENSETIVNLTRGAQTDLTLFSQFNKVIWENIAGKIKARCAPALSVLANSIKSTNDEDILINLCWTIFYLSEGPTERIQAVLDTNICSRLVELLHHSKTAVQAPVIRAVGNIASGNDSQTKAIIDFNVLSALLNLLNSSSEDIRGNACWTFSNITAGGTTQIQAVIDHGLVAPLIRILATGELKTKKEACWAICNATSGGLNKPEQIEFLVDKGCIQPLCDILKSTDNKIIVVALEGLDNILSVGEIEKANTINGFNPYALLVEECGGIDMIQQLQTHEDVEIYNKTYHIITKYFNDDENEEMEEAV